MQVAEPAGRQPLVVVVVHVDGQADLLEIVAAAGPRRRLADLLHGGHEQGDQDGDDGDDHQQLDEREAVPARPVRPGRYVPLHIHRIGHSLRDRGVYRNAVLVQLILVDGGAARNGAGPLPPRELRRTGSTETFHHRVLRRVADVALPLGSGRCDGCCRVSRAVGGRGRKGGRGHHRLFAEAANALRRLPRQVAGAGFSETPSLRATSAAIRTLHYFGGEIPHRDACVKFVTSCYDPATGGFGDTPRGKPDVFSTAVGAMAAVELKIADRYAGKCVQYLSQHAKSFEDIRIAAAALESLGKTSPRNGAWIETIRKMQNADGTFGKGPGQARATGGAVAAILRLGGKVDRAAVLAALKQEQRKTGGYGKADAGDASDLETTYRVMRTFMMLKSRPGNVPALEAFIAKCRNSDAGYGVAPGQPSSVGGCYYAAIIRRWLK